MSLNSSIGSSSNNYQHSWKAVLAATLATFTVVTTEMLPIGLLNPIAAQYLVSTSTAGLLMTLPAIIAAISAPIIILFTRTLDRKIILVFGAFLLMACNLIAAFTPHFSLLLISRAFVGICIGIIWSIAGGIAPRLVPPKKVSLATSLIFGGVAAASVIGVPLSVFIGEWLGWRKAFLLMGSLSFTLTLLLMYYFPPLPVQSIPTIKAFIYQIKRPIIYIALLITFLLVSGHFLVFTYIRPLLLSSDISGEKLGIILLLYGVSGILGNFIFGISSNSRLHLSIRLIITGIILALIIFIIAPLNIINTSINMILWGISYGGVSVALMTWMIVNSSKNIEITSSLYISIFNIGIAAGSVLGSLLIALSGINTVLIIAIVLLSIAFLCTK
ncbi:MAG TPA: MFS transporter [Providencia sp.]|uniref:MFS transporter n=2 Tax=Bacteria TaxID=2 RepID=UPI000E9DF472|nr:MFS transporter [Providencia sp.]HBO22010.1 MFS transporter [Providencia sp.]